MNDNTISPNEIITSGLKYLPEVDSLKPFRPKLVRNFYKKIKFLEILKICLGSVKNFFLKIFED